MNKLLFINVFVLFSSFIIIFAFDDGTDFQMGNYKLSQDDELLSNIYDQFGASYEQLAQEISGGSISAGNVLLTDSIVFDFDDLASYEKLAEKLIGYVPGTRNGIGKDEKSVAIFISLMLAKFDGYYRTFDEISNPHFNRNKLQEWNTRGWWEEICHQFSETADQSSQEDVKLLSLLAKIATYSEEFKGRREQRMWRKKFEQTLYPEEDDDSDFVIYDYETLAERLTTLISRRIDIDLSSMNMAQILLKFDKNIDWTEFSLALHDNVDDWYDNGNWEVIFNEFNAARDKLCQKDMKIFRVLKKILDR